MRILYKLLIITILMMGTTLQSRSLAVNVYAEPGIRVNTFPNPCPKILSVDVFFDKTSGPLEIRLRNVIGKEVVEMISDEKTGASNHYEIDLWDVPSGLYLLEITANVGNNPSKIIRRITKN